MSTLGKRVLSIAAVVACACSLPEAQCGSQPFVLSNAQDLVLGVR